MNNQLIETQDDGAIDLKNIPEFPCPQREIYSNDELIDPATANQAIKVLKLVNDEAPATIETAKNLSTVLIGAYPTREVNDADIYVRSIISIFTEFHPAIGKQAVDDITRRSKFLPTRADVFQACEAIRGKLMIAADRAQRHINEAERRAKAEQDREAAQKSWGSPKQRERALKRLSKLKKQALTR